MLNDLSCITNDGSCKIDDWNWADGTSKSYYMVNGWICMIVMNDEGCMDMMNM